MPLELANSAGLWWALLAIPIIALFILKVRLRRRQVSTLLFWDQLLQEHPPRAWWERLKNLLALLLQLAFLALIVGALVDPLWSWQKRDARRIIYVVDNSSSMNAIDDGETGTRLERAKTTLKRMIGTLRQYDTAAIVTAGGLPKVAMSTTGDVRRLAETVQQISPTDSPSQLPSAVELARRLNAESRDGNFEIIILTDGTERDSDELANADNVTAYRFGADAQNTAITAFQVRRGITDVTSFQVLVEVTNFGDETVDCRLELELEESVVDVIPLTLEPHKPWRETLDHISPAGGRLIAKLNIEDALATDNQALAVLPTQDPIPVVVVTPGSLFLQSVFEAIPNVELTIAESLPDELPPDAIVVLHQTQIDTIPSGSVIVIDPQSDSDLWTVGESIPEPIVVEQAKDSPLLAHIRLQNVMFPGAKEINFVSQPESLLESPGEQLLYAKLPRSSGDVVVLAVKLEDGDLPLRIAFPVMIKNALDSFLGGKGELRPAIATGQTTEINTGRSQATTVTELTTTDETKSPSAVHSPNEQSSWVLRSPSGSIKPLAVGESVRVGPFDEIGLWWAGPETEVAKIDDAAAFSADLVPIAVNLTNPAESDLQPNSELPEPPVTSAVWGGHSLWFYLALAGIIGICLEWFLYQRRIVA